MISEVSYTCNDTGFDACGTNFSTCTFVNKDMAVSMQDDL